VPAKRLGRANRSGPAGTGRAEAAEQLLAAPAGSRGGGSRRRPPIVQSAQGPASEAAAREKGCHRARAAAQTAAEGKQRFDSAAAGRNPPARTPLEAALKPKRGRAFPQRFRREIAQSAWAVGE